jgi:diaminopimelate decarboxylase
LHHFDYRNGALYAEDVAGRGDRARGRHAVLLLFDSHADAALPGVFRCLRRYSVAGLLRHEGQFQPGGSEDAGPTLGAGMDVVSEGELRRARAAGVPADKIVFSGVGKTEAEQRHALEEDILCFNVESEPELLQLSRVATRWAGPRGCRCASIRTWMPRPTPRSPPARRRTSSAFPGSAPARSMPKPRRCPA